MTVSLLSDSDLPTSDSAGSLANDALVNSPAISLQNSADKALLRINGLTLRRGNAAVLDEVSLTLLKGRTLGLVGESGAGKSTLAMAIIGLLMAPEVQLTGSMLYQGQQLVGLSDKRFSQLRGKKLV
jgi:ABC-type glutathione transport system ATPase component